jgi:NitT/TauT family transport system ATP-binding protein
MVVLAQPEAPTRDFSVAQPAIELRDVAHAYKGKTATVQALAKVDLSVARGSFVAILGPSGCGKTTLLRSISGLLAPSQGEVLLEGQPPVAAQKRRAIGWLAQDDGLLPWLNVAGNVGLPFAVRGASRSGASRVAEALLRVGLDASAAQYPHELSGGMRQRAALARALVARPQFLLLDEPFAHLDELTRERLGVLLQDLRAEIAPTTVLVTHSVLEAVRLADRVVVLSRRPGRLCLDVPVALPRPRREDQPGFGALVRELKAALGFSIL